MWQQLNTALTRLKFVTADYKPQVCTSVGSVARFGSLAQSARNRRNTHQRGVVSRRGVGNEADRSMTSPLSEVDTGEAAAGSSMRTTPYKGNPSFTAATRGASHDQTNSNKPMKSSTSRKAVLNSADSSSNDYFQASSVLDVGEAVDAALGAAVSQHSAVLSSCSKNMTVDSTYATPGCAAVQSLCTNSLGLTFTGALTPSNLVVKTVKINPNLEASPRLVSSNSTPKVTENNIAANAGVRNLFKSQGDDAGSLTTKNNSNGCSVLSSGSQASVQLATCSVTGPGLVCAREGKELKQVATVSNVALLNYDVATSRLDNIIHDLTPKDAFNMRRNDLVGKEHNFLTTTAVQCSTAAQCSEDTDRPHSRSPVLMSQVREGQLQAGDEGLLTRTPAKKSVEAKEFRTPRRKGSVFFYTPVIMSVVY